MILVAQNMSTAFILSVLTLRKISCFMWDFFDTLFSKPVSQKCLVRSKVANRYAKNQETKGLIVLGAVNIAKSIIKKKKYLSVCRFLKLPNARKEKGK